MDSNEFRYNLPSERIAQYPLEIRDSSKLLVYRNGKIIDSNFQKCIDFIPENSLLVFNDSRVVHARLKFKKSTGAEIEIFFLEPEGTEIFDAFTQKENCTAKCFIGNAKKWKNGILKNEIVSENRKIILEAELLEKKQDYFLVRFSWSPELLSFAEILELFGNIPLPPYIRRNDNENDRLRYQTVFAAINGSVAAPTAGLHFTEKIFSKLKKKNIEKTFVTLHVGAGTFKPVSVEDINNHIMHTEYFSVTAEAIKKMLEHIPGKIISVGTTSVRTLESLYWLGVQIIFKKNTPDLFLEQWFPYNQSLKKIPVADSLNACLDFMKIKKLEQLHASTRLMIIPGYEFKLTQGMFTNFHQPGSSLLTLVAAFTGNEWKNIYQHALDNEYRFLSYGDTCLLLS